jgi:hypothetical protein
MKRMGGAGARALAWLAGLTLAAQLTGCASFEFTKPAPAQKQPVTLKLSGEEMSGWTDMPIGVYRVPESQVVISGHQKGQAAGMLFGLIGVAVAHAANAGAGADRVKDAERLLKIKLDEPIQAEIDRLLADRAYARYFVKDERSGSTRLLLTPALVLSYVSEDAVRPFVVIRATMPGTEGKPLWTTRYIASSGEARPLLGNGGWLEAEAAELKRVVRANVALAMATLARDVSQPYRRDEGHLTMVQGHFPFVRPKLQTVGFTLNEDERYLTYVPKLGDALVFTGVNVLDKQFIKSRPAAKEDAVIKVVE